MANIVEKGTAPDERLPQMKKFKKKPTPKTMPGYNVAVYNERQIDDETAGRTEWICTRAAVRFQFEPLIVLYIRPE